MRSAHGVLAAAFLAFAGVSAVSSAQQVTIATPYRNMGDSFFERMGVGFSGNYRGINFNVGSFPLAIPPYGNYQPGAGLQTGFAIVGRNGQLNFNFDLSQGYTQHMTTQTPMVTLMNGQTGYFSDTSQTPFVIGQIPVVGAPVPQFGPIMAPPPFDDAAGGPPGGDNPRLQAMREALAGGRPPAARPRPAAAPGMNLQNVPPEPAAIEAAGPAGRLAAAQASTAGRPAPSVAEARRMHAAEQGDGDEEVKALFERGLAAEEAGKPGVAKIYYQQVARRASGDLKQRVQSRLDELHGTAPAR